MVVDAAHESRRADDFTAKHVARQARGSVVAGNRIHRDRARAAALTFRDDNVSARVSA
jgi:hypothetical protein